MLQLAPTALIKHTYTSSVRDRRLAAGMHVSPKADVNEAKHL